MTTPDLENPFGHAAALRHSHYSRYRKGRLVDPDTGEQRPALTRFVHDALRDLVLNDQFPCVAAKSAVRQGAYRFGLYEELGAAEAAAGLARDLFTFATELPDIESPFSTYLASFVQPIAGGEIAFETSLSQALQHLHDLDATAHRWDPLVSANADDVDVAFSVAGTAFFAVGLHAASSRLTRRFAWPTLVMTPCRQFEPAETDGPVSRFQAVLRQTDRQIQGVTTPMTDPPQVDPRACASS